MSANPSAVQTRPRINGRLTLVPTTQQDPAVLVLHQDVENALSMALFYMRTGQGNIPAASRKAVQALHALTKLRKAAANGGDQHGAR